MISPQKQLLKITEKTDRVKHSERHFSLHSTVLGRNFTDGWRYTCIIAHNHMLSTDKQYDEGKQLSTNLKN